MKTGAAVGQPIFFPIWIRNRSVFVHPGTLTQQDTAPKNTLRSAIPENWRICTKCALTSICVDAKRPVHSVSRFSAKIRARARHEGQMKKSNRFPFWAFSAFSLLAAACGSDTPDGNAASSVESCRNHCAALDDCYDSCWTDCEILVWSESCISAATAGGCAEFEQDVPSYVDLCTPSCNYGRFPDTCDGHGNITFCNENNRQMRARCSAVCDIQDRTYTGDCVHGGESDYCSCK